VAEAPDRLPERLSLDEAFRAAYYMTDQYVALEREPDEGLVLFLQYLQSDPAHFVVWHTLGRGLYGPVRNVRIAADRRGRAALSGLVTSAASSIASRLTAGEDRGNLTIVVRSVLPDLPMTARTESAPGQQACPGALSMSTCSCIRFLTPLLAARFERSRQTWSTWAVKDGDSGLVSR